MAMQEETLFIDGPVGELELRVATPTSWQAGLPVAICCHPHSLHGGSLQNKVVHIIAKTWHDLGAKVVRFNFRGVGKSQGEFDNSQGEQQDLLAVVKWLTDQAPGSVLWLAGFSFGAFVALSAHAQITPQRLLLAAPPVDMYPTIEQIQVQTPNWILVQGGQDEIVSAQGVKQWAEQQSHPAHIIWLEEAGHFFHGQLNIVSEQIKQLET